MNNNSSPQPRNQPETPSKPKPFYKKKGCWITAAIVIIGFLIIATVIGYFAYKKVTGIVNDFENEFLKKGYSKKMTQSAIISDSQKGDKLYICQKFTLNAEHRGNLALLAQQIKINAPLRGDLDAKGQAVKITENGHIEGDLKIFAQSATIKGIVEGNITGTAQSMRLAKGVADSVDIKSQQGIEYIESSVSKPDTENKSKEKPEKADSLIKSEPDTS